MRVLFASGIDEFCHRYAILHWAEQLATQGIASTIRAHTDPRLAADVADHDVAVLYRVPYSDWIAHLVARARGLRRPTVFAVDDLIIDPTVQDLPPLRRLDAEEKRLWLDGVERYRRTLLACDAFLGTSAPLVAAGHALGKPAYLHRAGLAGYELALGGAAHDDARASHAAATNSVSERDVPVAPVEPAHGMRRRAEVVEAARRMQPRAGVVRLGYFSGTPSHDDDFACVVPSLIRLLEREPRVELVLGGHLAAIPSLARFHDCIVRVPFVAWTELPYLLAQTDVNLAPLEWRHPFVAAKGAIKYLEAAACSVPTVASPTEAYGDAIRDGVTGFLAPEADDWDAALALLVTDRARREQIGAAARADVVDRFSPVVQGRALAATLTAIAGERVTHAERRSARTSEGGRLAGAPSFPVDLDEVALARAFPTEVARRAREPLGRPGVALAQCTVATPPLGEHVVLVQRFLVPENGLTRVDVYTITYGQTLDHVLDATLERDDGSSVGAWTFPAALAPDRDWFAIECAPEWRSAGRRYLLTLGARGTGPGNALSFGAGASGNGNDPYAQDTTVGPTAITDPASATGPAGDAAPPTLALRLFFSEPDTSQLRPVLTPDRRRAQER